MIWIAPRHSPSVRFQIRPAMSANGRFQCEVISEVSCGRGESAFPGGSRSAWVGLTGMARHDLPAACCDGAHSRHVCGVVRASGGGGRER